MATFSNVFLSLDVHMFCKHSSLKYYALQSCIKEHKMKETWLRTNIYIYIYMSTRGKVSYDAVVVVNYSSNSI